MVNMESVTLYNYIYFLIILGAFKCGQCENVTCYSCSSKEDIRCLNPVDKLGLKRCDTTALIEMKNFAEGIDAGFGPRFEVDLDGERFLPLRCMKQVTIVRGKEYTIRGCQLDSGGHLDICTVVRTESKQLRIGEVTHCSLCHENGCNFTSNLESFKISTIFMLALIQKIFSF